MPVRARLLPLRGGPRVIAVLAFVIAEADVINRTSAAATLRLLEDESLGAELLHRHKAHLGASVEGTLRSARPQERPPHVIVGVRHLEAGTTVLLLLLLPLQPRGGLDVLKGLRDCGICAHLAAKAKVLSGRPRVIAPQRFWDLVHLELICGSCVPTELQELHALSLEFRDGAQNVEIIAVVAKRVFELPSDGIDAQEAHGHTSGQQHVREEAQRRLHDEGRDHEEEEQEHLAEMHVGEGDGRRDNHVDALIGEGGLVA
mmetsp:Transcript_53951/g.118156  ORF Transcript_53951/g.118156 Transcript_53951/m.118156 type:complete len:259 (+) Transcript_53951:274-1050(+)